MPGNPFDQFDAQAANPFDQFDTPKPSASQPGLYDYLAAGPGGGLVQGATEGSQEYLIKAPIHALSTISDLGGLAPNPISETLRFGTKAIDDWIAKQRENYQAARNKFTNPASKLWNVAGSTLPAIAATSVVGPAAPAQTMVGNIGRAALTGAGTGAIGGFGSPSDANSDYWSQKAGQAGMGAVTGGVLGAAQGAFTPTAPRPVAPVNNTSIGAVGSRALPADPLAQPDINLVQDMRRLGVDIRPGQASTSRSMRIMEDQASGLPASGYQQQGMQIAPQAQREQWVRAVSRTFGEDDPRLTQDVMARASARLSDNFNTVFDRNQIRNTPEIFQSLQGIRGTAQDQLGEEAAPVLRAIDRAQSRLLDEGALPGRMYQTMRQRGGALDHVANSDNPTIAFYGNRVREILDDAFQHQAAPEDAALLAQTRDQFRNMMTVAPLAAKAPTGEISPGLLLGRVVQEWGPENFSRYGAGDLGTLAQGGQRFLKEPPNSGTADRSFVMQMLNHPISTAARTAAGVTASRGINNAINSPVYANRLAPGLWPQPQAQIPFSPPPGAGFGGDPTAILRLLQSGLVGPMVGALNQQPAQVAP